MAGSDWLTFNWAEYKTDSETLLAMVNMSVAEPVAIVNGMVLALCSGEDVNKTTPPAGFFRRASDRDISAGKRFCMRSMPKLETSFIPAAIR